MCLFFILYSLFFILYIGISMEGKICTYIKKKKKKKKKKGEEKRGGEGDILRHGEQEKQLGPPINRRRRVPSDS
jgi:hypothetical protein